MPLQACVQGFSTETLLPSSSRNRSSLCVIHNLLATASADASSTSSKSQTKSDIQGVRFGQPWSNVTSLSCVHLCCHSVPAGCSAMTAQAARNHINVMRLLGQPSRPPGRCQRPNLCIRSHQPPLRQLAVFSSAGVDSHLARVSAWLSSVHASVLTA